jgi:hypothetical protein
MAANTIGRGNIIITASMDDAIRGLDRLEKKSQQTKKAVEGGWRKSEFAKEAFKGTAFGDFLKDGAGAGVGAIVGSVVIEQLGRGAAKLGEWVSGAKETRRQLEDAAKAAEFMAKSLDRALAKRDEARGAIANRGDRLGATALDIRKTDEELSKARDKVARLRAAVVELNSDLNPDTWTHWMGGTLGDRIKAAEGELADASAAAEKLSDTLFKLGDAHDRLKDPSKDPAVIGGVNSLTESLREQAATWGLTGRQAQIAAMRFKGATQDQLADADELARKLDRLDEIQNKAFQPTPMVGAMEAGSAAAYSLTTRFQVQGKEAERNGKRQADALDQIKADIRKLVNKAGGHTFGSI